MEQETIWSMRKPLFTKLQCIERMGHGFVHIVFYIHIRLTPVLKTNFHQCVISYTYSQSNSDGSVLKQSHQS